MSSFSTKWPRRSFLMLTVSMVTCLILLINLSFKIIELNGMIFTANSLLCPLIAVIYLWVLKQCDLGQQRHVLHQALLALYLFSICVYLLINLPAAEYMNDNPAYQIVFEDIPKKFFASTFAFALSFYLPHVFCCARKPEILSSPKKRLILALAGGFFFFTLNFILLFSHPLISNFKQMYGHSLLVSVCMLLIVYILSCFLFIKPAKPPLKPSSLPQYLTRPLYHYLVCISVIFILICLACEYRLISFPNGLTLGASGIFFPLTLMMSNLVGELYGYKANFRLAIVLILSELVFDLLLMGAIALPAPEFFNINPYYSSILPRRVLASTLTLFVGFVGNAMLLENLRYTKLGLNWCSRILIANILVISLLCLVNYSLLYVGVYPYEQIFNVAINSWAYKLIMTFASLPLLLWLYKQSAESTAQS